MERKRRLPSAFVVLRSAALLPPGSATPATVRVHTHHFHVKGLSPPAFELGIPADTWPMRGRGAGI
jgi:hypothetical protein